ncbi:MAG: tetratricopeptide repeat protein [Gammaproteobacteria bacterium]|nr:tetratricopeptide repeat protein [Gammaproteobacteria bacterium]
MDDQPSVVDVSVENFREVIDRSNDQLVVLLFWAEQIEPSAVTKDYLVGVAPSYAGKVVFGLVDVAANPQIAQQLQIQALPSIQAIQEGQIAGRLDGPQTEQALREFLDPFTLSSADVLKQSIASSIANEDWETALQILQEAITEEPTNHSFRVECADVMILKGDLEAAKQILATIPEDFVDRARPATRIEIAQEAAAMGSLSDIENTIESDANDLSNRYAYSIVLASLRRYEEALEQAMFILRQDRSFRDDIGRETMVRILNLLGSDSALAKRYRRQMFAFMH